jgi:GDP-6-deoxy-D-talose 4-dehydrogenase
VMDKVLVSGVDGFTGRYLAPLLASAGYEVHGLAQRVPVDRVDGVSSMHVADLTQPAELVDIIAAVAPEFVVHLAGISFVASNPELMYGVNLVGTRNLLEALASLSRAPQAIVLASSANVYGNVTEGLIDEMALPAPENDYAVSKLAMEYVAKTYSSRLPLIICRPFNYTGIGQAETFLLPKIAAHIRKGAAEIELGNLDIARDFSDVRDVSSVYAELIQTPAAIGATLNICSGKAYTLREVLDLVENISGKKLSVRVNPAFVRSNEVRVLLGDRSRIDAIVPGSCGKIPLRETLRWMIEG